MCKFIHGQTKDGYRYTAAFNDSEDEIITAVAVTSKKDNFSRKIGRLISEGRLNKNYSFKLKKDHDDYPDRQLRTILNNLTGPSLINRIHYSKS